MTVERIAWSIVQLTVMVQVDKHLGEPIRFQSELAVLVGSEMLQRAFFKYTYYEKSLSHSRPFLPELDPTVTQLSVGALYMSHSCRGGLVIEMREGYLL